MNEEFKITMPRITEAELTKIDNNLHEIVNEFIKATVKDKELLLSQHIIKRLEEENEQLKQQLEQRQKSLNEIKDHLKSKVDDENADFETLDVKYDILQIIDKVLGSDK